MIALAVVLLPNLGHAASECDGGVQFGSTFAQIEERIFNGRGCTNELCHGDARSGDLDLRDGAAYDALVDRPAATVSNRLRVAPGDRQASLLWINLAARTLPSDWTAPLRPMPPGDLPAISEDELELIRLWIAAGAPYEGVVPGSEGLLDDCLAPSAAPEPIKALPPPPAGEGVQLQMPVWKVQPRSEREVCFASYYDFSGQVPDRFLSADGTRFRYAAKTGRQDLFSHHLFVNRYGGDAPLNDPAWGEFRCRGGAADETPCVPGDPTACPEGACATTPITAFGCGDLGPDDGHLAFAEDPVGLMVLGQPARTSDLPERVYGEIPLTGMLVWNSHAFNLGDQSKTVRAWVNFEFADPQERSLATMNLISREGNYKMNAPAFSTDEPCEVHVLPERAELFELLTHMHQRGRRFRVFLGSFTCNGEPPAPDGDGEPCSPLGYDFDSRDVCNGSPCRSFARTPAGDCDYDDSVTVDEILRGVGIALGNSPVGSCDDADRNRDRSVSVDEIISAVVAALEGVPPPVERDGSESLLYLNTDYRDPWALIFDPPHRFPGVGSRAADRAITYCALYDNGFVDPQQVKRRSTSLPSPVPGFGGPCEEATNCTDGWVGQPCSGETDQERDHSCDTSPGSADGSCDACPLLGGATTEDEMMIIIGQYFVAP